MNHSVGASWGYYIMQAFGLGNKLETFRRVEFVFLNSSFVIFARELSYEIIFSFIDEKTEALKA